MLTQIGAMGRALLTPFLTDVATLEAPSKAASSGWATAVTGVPCRYIEAAGGMVAVPGGVVFVREPRTYFLPSVTLTAGSRVTLTSRGSRQFIVASVVAEPDAPLTYVTADGTR